MSKKIMIIDDEPDTLNYLAIFMERNGYKTITASNGEEGLEKVKKEKVDLICLDIMMPKKSGVGFYRLIKKENDLKDIPIIIITGFTKDINPKMDFERFLSERKSVNKPEGYLEKPVDREELLKIIKENIG